MNDTDFDDYNRSFNINSSGWSYQHKPEVTVSVKKTTKAPVYVLENLKSRPMQRPTSGKRDYLLELVHCDMSER